MDIECSRRPFLENSRTWRRGLLAPANERNDRWRSLNCCGVSITSCMHAPGLSKESLSEAVIGLSQRMRWRVVRAADSEVRLFLRWYPSNDKYYSWYRHVIITGCLIPPLRSLSAAINIGQ